MRRKIIIGGMVLMVLGGALLFRLRIATADGGILLESHWPKYRYIAMYWAEEENAVYVRRPLHFYFQP